MPTKLKPVVVTTKFRGVFFGYLSGKPGETVILKKARNCIRWESSIKGFVGLSTTGPDSKCRVGPACKSMKLYGVTAILDMTKEAVKAWEAAPWR